MKLAIKFRDHIISFLDELIEQFPTEADIIIARIFIRNQIDPVYIADCFSKTLLQYEEYIQNRDEKFFIDNDNLFSYFDDNKVLHFKRIWQSDTLDDDDRQVMWDWMDAFVLLSKRYKNVTS